MKSRILNLFVMVLFFSLFFGLNAPIKTLLAQEAVADPGGEEGGGTACEGDKCEGGEQERESELPIEPGGGGGGGTQPSFSLSCSPVTQTITTGDTASFNLITTPIGTFASAVTFTSGITPTNSAPPTVSYENNGATPEATTRAVITTTASTTSGTYTLQFTGTGGGVTKNCSVQLVVNSVPSGFTIGLTQNPQSVAQGQNAVFNVQVNCFGGFAGPVHSLAATIPFPNVTHTFSRTDNVTCGSSVTLTIGNTGSVPSGYLSPAPPATQLYQTITVTGSGAGGGNQQI